MRLAFVLTDFYLPADLPEKLPTSLATFAAALQFAGKKKLSGDWRDWLVSQSGAATRDEPRGTASLAQQLWSSPDLPQACWFADPVHCRPTLDRVQLAPAGCLRLDADEMTALLARFSRDFAGSGWRLKDACDGRLLLGLDRPVEPVETVSPQRWLGRDIASALPRGPGAAVLRAVSAEVEMWLFGSPLNQERQAKGLSPVTQLWFWDRSFPAHVLTKRTTGSVSNDGAPPMNLLANDAFVSRLAQVQGFKIQREPASLANLLDNRAAAICLHTVNEAAGSSLLEFVAEHLEPAAAALGAGKMTQLAVVANDTEFLLDWRRFCRFWRFRRAAHQVLRS